MLPRKWTVGPTSSTVESIVEGLENSWSISAGAGRVLARMVVEEHCTRILEFGAGVSSQIFAAVLAENGGGRLTSVEENPEWCKEAWAYVSQSSDVDAKLIQSSIHLRVDGLGIYYGYDHLEDIAARGPYDLIFVDAPWHGYGRDGSLHASLEALSPGGLIVLDDAKRVGEQRTVRRWMLNYPGLVLVANDASAGRGLAILQKASGPSRQASPVSKVAEVWGSGLFEVVTTVRARHKHEARQNEIKHAG
jgi:predicted O-methyltransferase YrrM